MRHFCASPWPSNPSPSKRLSAPPQCLEKFKRPRFLKSDKCAAPRMETPSQHGFPQKSRPVADSGGAHNRQSHDQWLTAVAPTTNNVTTISVGTSQKPERRDKPEARAAAATTTALRPQSEQAPDLHLQLQQTFTSIIYGRVL